MAKFEGDIRATGHHPIQFNELFVALGRVPLLAADRHDTLALYLSGAEGWRDARTALGGTFAPRAAPATGLIGSEDK